METLVPVLVGLGCLTVVALFTVLIVVSVRRENARQQRIRQWAAANGWVVTNRPKVDWAKHLPGWGGDVSLLVSSTVAGRPVAVGEYSYTSESSNSDGSKSRTTYRYVVTAVRLTQAYPPLAVRERGALSRLGRGMFGDNPAATGHEVFDQRFRVQTKDPALARALIGPALIAEHLAGRVPEWSIAGPDLLTWRSGHLEDPAQIPALVGPLLRVAQLFGR